MEHKDPGIEAEAERKPAEGLPEDLDHHHIVLGLDLALKSVDLGGVSGWGLGQGALNPYYQGRGLRIEG